MDSGFNMLGQFQGDSSLGMEPSHQAQSPAFPSIGSNGVHISLVEFYPDFTGGYGGGSFDMFNFSNWTQDM